MVNDRDFTPWTDPDATPLIRFQNVTKRFGDFTAIDNVSLDIYPQEFFALLGPSGCGKTTLMRMLGGFEEPTSGSITIDGQNMAGIPPNKRAVNMMFQSYALFPHLTVEANIAFGLRREGMAQGRLQARVDEMVRLTQLDRFRHRKPHQLSGGQRQRVALARALAKAPKLLLLDEPLGALDRKLREETQFELMDIQEKTGTTFVIVTHDQEEAMTVSTRVAVMDAGVIVQIDTPERIYEAPNSTYVADFIGDVNLIEGTAKATEKPAAPGAEPAALEPQSSGFRNWLLNPFRGKPDAPKPEKPKQLPPPTGLMIHWTEGADPIHASNADPDLADRVVTFAIRPEKITVSAQRPRDAANAVRGKVVDIGYLGNLSTYHVELPQGQILKAQSTNTRRAAARDFTWDDDVWLSWSDTAGVVLAK